MTYFSGPLLFTLYNRMPFGLKTLAVRTTLLNKQRTKSVNWTGSLGEFCSKRSSRLCKQRWELWFLCCRVWLACNHWHYKSCNKLDQQFGLTWGAGGWYNLRGGAVSSPWHPLRPPRVKIALFHMHCFVEKRGKSLLTVIKLEYVCNFIHVFVMAVYFPKIQQFCVL
jgi:hypothetical protein